MTILEIIALLTPMLQSGEGITISILIATLGAWIGGKGLNLLFKMPLTRRLLGYGLKTAGAPAVILGKWFQAGPLHWVFGPLVCILVFALFWLFAFMDRLLTYLKPDTLAMVQGLEKMLQEMGSTDRQLYIQAKTMTAPQVTAVSQIAEAVAAGPGNLTPHQQDALLKARAIGYDFQQNRLTANP
jgi:hypothetical protein